MGQYNVLIMGFIKYILGYNLPILFWESHLGSLCTLLILWYWTTSGWSLTQYYFWIMPAVQAYMINYFQQSRVSLPLFSGKLGSRFAAGILKPQQTQSCCQTLWPWPLMDCYSAAVQGVFSWFCFPSLIVWTNYQRALQMNVPRFLGFGFLWESTLQMVLLPCSSSGHSVRMANW